MVCQIWSGEVLLPPNTLVFRGSGMSTAVPPDLPVVVTVAQRGTAAAQASEEAEGGAAGEPGGEPAAGS